MDPLLKKLMFKGQSPVLILRAPEELKEVPAKFGVPVDNAVMKRRYGFALAFAKSLADADEIGKTARDALEENAVFWMAYPKGTSKKYKGADINRDTGNARMQKHGFQGVSMVAIDDDWSAMRFKRMP